MDIGIALALKYSHAVYSAALAKSPQVLNKVQTDLSTIQTSVKNIPEINAFIYNPTLSAKDRSAGLAQLYSRVEAKKEPLSSITKNLFAVLSENGRLGEIVGVIEGFNELVAKYKGELNVVVTSAVPLTQDVLSRLESTLKQSQVGKQSKSLKLVNKVNYVGFRAILLSHTLHKVNPSVLGGLVVDLGDKTIDLSVLSRVTKFNNALQRELLCFVHSSTLKCFFFFLRVGLNGGGEST